MIWVGVIVAVLVLNLCTAIINVKIQKLVFDPRDEMDYKIVCFLSIFLGPVITLDMSAFWILGNGFDQLVDLLVNFGTKI